MANTHKVSPERFRHLSQLIEIATKTEDWPTLKRYDLQLRELLVTHDPFTLGAQQDPRLTAEIERAKQAHLQAFMALSQATDTLKTQLGMADEQKERAQAYQLAMTLE
ncbi:LafD [Vibrio sp. 10N.286.49.C2]|uniref:LafD n=1 Tax=unclassified Vibrio TaxID=2614977 RepID=UPI000C853B7C|nr:MULTISPECIES: LafD [unclassified Vibrio]PMH37359.1 LafD [Vibrio sp. 10N.286.49.C2]PMH49447.1 LafD [Vibrio sp. 10N.286.49.B1]PMH83868.1 LafD [Vibrio sp. 10N.286.48.B7]